MQEKAIPTGYIPKGHLLKFQTYYQLINNYLEPYKKYIYLSSKNHSPHYSPHD